MVGLDDLKGLFKQNDSMIPYIYLYIYVYVYLPTSPTGPLLVMATLSREKKGLGKVLHLVGRYKKSTH